MSTPNNDELETDLDFELDKSSMLCERLRESFEDVAETISMYETFKNVTYESGGDQLRYFSDFLRENNALHSQWEVTRQAQNNIDQGTSPHAFEKQRGRPLVDHSEISSHYIPPATPTVANASGSTNVSKLLERLRKAQAPVPQA